MIKCNITACGIIVSSAQEKTNKEGGKFLAFTIVVPIEGRDKSVNSLIMRPRLVSMWKFMAICC